MVRSKRLPVPKLRRSRPSLLNPPQARSPPAALFQCGFAPVSFDAQYDEIPTQFLEELPVSLGLEIADEQESAAFVYQTGHANPQLVSGSGLPASGVPPWEIVPEDTLYLAQAMCQTMAHGPESLCSDGTATVLYSCPGEWSPIADPSLSQLNVYDRWGENYFANNPAIRMVCGDSTIYIPTPDYAVKFWDYYAAATYFVGDAFIGSLSQDAVSICLTKGGQQPTESPIWQDQFFVAEGNTFPLDNTIFSIPNHM